MAILWIFCRLLFIMLILRIVYSALLEHYHILLSPAVALRDALIPRGQVYSAVHLLRPLTTLSQALHHCYGRHLKSSLSYRGLPAWKEEQLLCTKVCLCMGRRRDLRHVCPTRKQEAETISPNTFTASAVCCSSVSHKWEGFPRALP